MIDYHVYIRQENKCYKVNYEVKGQLAKLLATEDLIIENRNVSTASFDVERRVLLPMWEKDTAVYDLLVGHEVGTHYTHQQRTGCLIIQRFHNLL